MHRKKELNLRNKIFARESDNCEISASLSQGQGQRLRKVVAVARNCMNVAQIIPLSAYAGSQSMNSTWFTVKVE